MRSLAALVLAACVVLPAVASAQPYHYPPSPYGYHHREEWREGRRMEEVRHHQMWCHYHPFSRGCR